MIRSTFRLLAVTATLLAVAGEAWGQTQNYFGTSGALNGSVWSTNPAGPYTNTLDTTGGAIINFGNAGATFNGTSIVVAGINATANASLGTSSGTISNFNNGVITVDVANGVTLDFGNQTFTGSGSAGYIKTGDGILALAGGTYGGGFTLNAGTVVMRGINALGGGATNTLALNGGVLASTGTLTPTGKYAGGITIGGNVQLGDTGGLASNTATLTFSDAVSLGNSTRTLTLGNAGTTTLNGIVSGNSGTGLIVAANANGAGGKLVLGAANTYTGATNITGGTLQLASTGSINNSTSITVGTGATYNVASVTGYTLGSAAAQTLQGTGTVIGSVTVAAGSTLRGGSATTPTGTLNLGATTVNNGATLAVDLNGTNATANGKLALGANTFNLLSTSGDKATIALLNDGGLTNGGTYTLDLATGTNLKLNGGTTTLTDADFNLTSGSGTWAFNNVSLAVNSGILQLSFQVAPVPEPATVLTIGAVGLGLMSWVRRRRKAATV